VINFNNFLDCFNLHNFVNLSTHKSGSSLDLCFSEETKLIINVEQGEMFSDHHAVLFDIKFAKQNETHNTNTISYRP
jgi:hypothetical protein